MAVTAGTATLPVVPALAKNFSRDLAGQMTGPMTKAGTQAGQRSGQESGRRFGRHFSGGIRAGIGPVRGIFRGFGPQVAAAFGAAAIVAGIKSVTDEAREAAMVGRQTAAVLKSTGGAANVSAKQIESLATALSNKVGVDDEAIQSSQNLLLTFRGIRNEAGKGNDIFNQSSTAILDMTASMNRGQITAQGLKAATIQVGKALNDPIKGMTALSRVGVTFNDQQKAQIKTLVESGDKLSAQKIILAELRAEFGGSAAASADAGKRFKVFVDNLKERIGGVLLPVLNRFLGFLVDKLPGAIETAKRVLKPLTIAVGALVTSFADPDVTTKGFIGLLQQIGSAARGLYDAGRKAAGELLKGIQEKFDEFKPKLATFKDRLVAGIKQFAQPVIDALKVGIATGDWEPLGRALGDALLATLRGAGDLSGKFLAWAREQATKVDWVEIGKTVGSHAFGFAVGFASALGSDLVKTLREHPLDFATAVIGFLGVGKIGGVIAKILAKIPFLRAFAPLFSSLNKLTAPINNAIGRVVGLFGSGFREGLERAFPRVAGAVRRGIGDLVAWVSLRAEAFRNAGRRLVTNLGVGIGEQTGLVVKNIGQVIRFITNPFTRAGGWLVRGGRNVIAGLVAGIRGVLGSVSAAIRDVVVRITRPFGGAMVWIRDRWRAGWAVIQGVGSRAWAALRAGLANFLSPFRARWNAGVTWVKDRWVAIWNRIREVGASAWSALRAGASGFVGALRKILGGVVSAVAGPFRSARNIINAFLSGADSIASHVGVSIPWRIPKLQQGGVVGGSGRGDKMLALLEPNEVVIPNRKADRKRVLSDPKVQAKLGDVGGDPSELVLRMQKGGMAPRLTGLVGRVQNFIRSVDPLPYVWGAAGPGGYDCSGLASEIVNRLTGRPSFHRLFTTSSIGPGVAGLQPGTGTFTIGTTPGSGHMASNLAGLGAEARGSAAGILTGGAARSVTSFARQFYLPQVGGNFVDQGGPSLFDVVGRLLSKLLKPLTGGLGRLGGGVMGDLAGALGRKVATGIANWIRSKATGLFGAGGAGGMRTGGLSAAEAWIIAKESGGNVRADNPTSTAFGLGQLLLGNRKLYLGADYATTDYAKQLSAFRAYVRDRYGTAENAKAFWESHGWYGGGLDTVVKRPTMIGVGERGPERVTVTPLGSAAAGGGITVNVTVNGAVGPPRDVARALVPEIRQGLREAQRRAGVPATQQLR